MGGTPCEEANILQSANEHLTFKTLPHKNNYYQIKTIIISSEHTDRWLLLILQGMGLGLIRAYLPKIRVCPGLQSQLETRKQCFLAFSRVLLLSLGYGFFVCLQSQTQYLSGKNLSHISLSGGYFIEEVSCNDLQCIEHTPVIRKMCSAPNPHSYIFP